jgi:hypothetical protein
VIRVSGTQSGNHAVKAVDVLHVERRVLAHQDHVQIAERDFLFLAVSPPACLVVLDVEPP